MSPGAGSFNLAGPSMSATSRKERSRPTNRDVPRHFAHVALSSPTPSPTPIRYGVAHGATGAGAIVADPPGPFGSPLGRKRPRRHREQSPF
jgi:hypothetical protein